MNVLVATDEGVGLHLRRHRLPRPRLARRARSRRARARAAGQREPRELGKRQEKAAIKKALNAGRFLLRCTTNPRASRRDESWRASRTRCPGLRSWWSPPSRSRSGSRASSTGQYDRPALLRVLAPAAMTRSSRLLPGRVHAASSETDGLRLGGQGHYPICRSFTGATGLEPATSGVTGRRSNQLNYAPQGDGQCSRAAQ